METLLILLLTANLVTGPIVSEPQTDIYAEVLKPAVEYTMAQEVEEEVVEPEPEETYIFEYDSTDPRTCIKEYIEHANEENGTDVDPILAVAISRLETGNWSSKAYIYKNNFGGLMGKNGLKSYDTPEEGLEAFYKCLCWYRSKGMTDISSMSSVYCPDDGTWEKLVKQIYKEETR